MRILLVGLMALQPMTGTLGRLGQYVEGYYRQARTIVGRETVTLQPLGPDLRPDGNARELIYEVRVEWQGPRGAAASPTLVRTLLQVRGDLRNAQQDPQCFDLEPVSFDPLGMLLVERQPRYVFTDGGRDRMERRELVMLDYRPVARKSPRVTWRGDCASIDLGSHVHGRVWADPTTGEVLRVDTRMAGPFQFALPIGHIRAQGPVSQTIDRSDTSIRFSEVEFRDPEESVLLPSSIQTLTVIHHGAVPRLLKTQTFSDYKRFVTGVRVVK